MGTRTCSQGRSANEVIHEVEKRRTEEGSSRRGRHASALLRHCAYRELHEEEGVPGLQGGTTVRRPDAQPSIDTLCTGPSLHSSASRLRKAGVAQVFRCRSCSIILLSVVPCWCCLCSSCPICSWVVNLSLVGVCFQHTVLAHQRSGTPNVPNFRF